MFLSKTNLKGIFLIYIDDTKWWEVSYSISCNINEFNLEVYISLDGSQEAMTSVAYLQLEQYNNQHLRTSKTQIAKVTTIPRLELQAAVMTSRFTKTIEKEHSLKIEEELKVNSG